MINNRQAGRRRGRGGQQQRPQGGSGRPDNGNRIDNRARGNAAQLLEKYKTLARDAQMQGDRVNVEYYLQFADHYFRVLAETRARFEENGGAPSTRRIQGATLDEDEPDYEEEERAAEQARGEQHRGEQHRGDQNRGDQQRYRQEGQNGRQDRDGNRTYQPGGQQNGQQSAAPEQRGNGQDYDDRSRGRVNGNGSGEIQNGGYDRQAEQPQRDERPRNERHDRNERAPRPMAPPVERVEESVPVEADAPAAAPVEEPRRGRGRPRRDAAPVAPVVKDDADDGGFLSSLPPSLNVSAIVAPEADTQADTAEKPRRRRGRPPASEAGTPS